MADQGDSNKGATEGCKCFIGNITYNTGERELLELFGKYGVVKECRVAIDGNTGRSRGFAFVMMETPEEAQAAIDGISGSSIDGRQVRVEVSTGERRPKRDFNESGGRDRDFGGRGGHDRSYGDRNRDFNNRDRDYGRERDYGRDRNGGGRDRDYGREKDRDHGRERNGRDRDGGRDGGRDNFNSYNRGGDRDRSRERDGSRDRSRERR
eukprot:gene8832-9738_t